MEILSGIQGQSSRKRMGNKLSTTIKRQVLYINNKCKKKFARTCRNPWHRKSPPEFCRNADVCQCLTAVYMMHSPSINRASDDSLYISDYR